MPRREVNRIAEMETFVRVVDLGGFSPAARAEGLTPSAVSKLIARLEARLGARLLNRSTRQLQLTPEGGEFYERARRVIADLIEAERVARAGEAVAGNIRISSSASYARRILTPRLSGFLNLHPGLTLDLTISEAVVDLLAERIDVAIRAGSLKTSSLIARTLGETEMLVVASPEYLALHGAPRDAADLTRHHRIGLGHSGAVPDWGPGTARITASHGEAARDLALAGAGLARMTAFSVRDDIAAGRLVALPDWTDAPEKKPFHAVFVGQGDLMPGRVRALLDFLARDGRVG